MARNPRHIPGLPKRCTLCKQEFPYTEEFFPLNGTDADGTPRLKGKCRNCYRAYKRVDEQDRKRGVFRQYPKNEETAQDTPIPVIESATRDLKPVAYEELPAFATLLKVREIAKRAERRARQQARAVVVEAHQRAKARLAEKTEKVA
jgi:hypothetical protein